MAVRSAVTRLSEMIPGGSSPLLPIKESKMFYKQCKLIKKTDKGMIQDVRWIPEKYAKRNSILELHINGEWDDGWKVMSVGNRMEDKNLLERSRDHTKQRKASDI